MPCAKLSEVLTLADHSYPRVTLKQGDRLPVINPKTHTNTDTCRLNFMSEPVPSQTQTWEDLCLAAVRQRRRRNANGVSLSSNVRGVKDMDENLTISVIFETPGSYPIQTCVCVTVHVCMWLHVFLKLANKLCFITWMAISGTISSILITPYNSFLHPTALHRVFLAALCLQNSFLFLTINHDRNY